MRGQERNCAASSPSAMILMKSIRSPESVFPPIVARKPPRFQFPKPLPSHRPPAAAAVPVPFSFLPSRSWERKEQAAVVGAPLTTEASLLLPSSCM